MVKIQDTDMLLISITSENGIHKLWTLRILPERSDEEECSEESVYESERSLSNRERIQRELQEESARGVQGNFISQLTIQGQTMTFISSESAYYREEEYRAYMKLQYFVEKGLELENFADVELNRLSLTFYKQDDSEPFPDVDVNKELDITLKFDSTVRRVPIHTEPIALEFGEVANGIKHSFYDPFHDKNRFFYINALTRYDLWKETEKQLEKPIPEEFTEKEWQQFKAQQFRALGTVCSRNQDLALVEYESEDNIQLNFYAEHYLNEKPAPSFDSIGMSILFSSDREFGHNGLKSRTDSTGPVDKTFEGSIVIELLSYYVELPEKIIKL
ncbi:hypothetical protein [Saccharibacillus sacchari]|uniref:Uncharacterized protein n=1 Tax=Saccharibacillus sacchari TaxID=456493 RepID=A0ACC6PEI0_9BACL